jgi:hypothetical protein
MSPAPEPGCPITLQGASLSVSGAPSAGARSAKRSRGGHRTLGVGSGVDRDSRSAASGVGGTAGREPTAR